MTEAPTLDDCRRIASAAFSAPVGDRRTRDAALYLAHVCAGASFRALARQEGCQASTILRAVRRVEARRDDPLVDALLDDMSGAAGRSAASPRSVSQEGPVSHPRIVSSRKPSVAKSKAEEAVEKEARRILRRLSEPRAFLALARGAEVACVFRKADGGLTTLARTPLDMAKAFAARDWMTCVHGGANMARYEISAAGRAWLKRRLVEDGDARRRKAEAAAGLTEAGFAEAPSAFARQHQVEAQRVLGGEDGARKVRVNAGETPLGWLAKRKDSDGRPFLTGPEVAAGERLREEFELAQMGPRVAQDWRAFLTPKGPRGGGGKSPADGPAEARRRVAQALDALGPGLEDAALRACCFLEGLEATERRMGWSARSGKVVLKIALGRLAQHYGYAGAVARRDDARPAAATPETRSAA
ncbi:MAG: DUF6456 domain-containing protein [Pseudomonadota bacterium]